MHTAITGTIATRICYSLNLMVNQAKSAPKKQPQTKVTDLSFATWDRETTDSLPTNQETFLSKLVKSGLGSVPGRPDTQVGNLKNKAGLPQD